MSSRCRVFWSSQVAAATAAASWRPGPCPGTFPDEHVPPATVSPSEIVVAPGDNATFTVAAPGLGTPTYQWFRAPRNGELVRIDGAAGASYTIVAAQPGDDGATFMALVDGGFMFGRLVEFSSAGTLTVR